MPPDPPPSESPSEASALGLMQGSPPPDERLVTLANWQDPPFNRWGFQHVRELIPTARIRASGAPWQLPRDERDLGTVRLEPVDGWAGTFARLLDDTFTDGILVLHGGRILYERYFNGLRPDTPHLLMSVSKSITATVAGALIDDGRLHRDDLVVDHLPELAGTSFDGCRIAHLLDMRAGTRFNEDYDSADADVRIYEQVCLWRPRSRDGIPGDLVSYYRTLDNDGPHGGPFRYRSVLTDVLGWAIERAGGARLADLIGERLWGPMGAEFDAEVTVDAHGHALADGGVCATLRDPARLGQMMLQGGLGGPGRVVSRAWIDDILSGDADSIAAYADSPDAGDSPPGAYYRNAWWVEDHARPLYAGQGINGQMVLIDGASQGVVAKLSTWPEAWTDERFRLTFAGCRDLLARLPELAG